MEIKFSKRLAGKATKNIFDEIDDKVSELKDQGVKVIDFGVGDPAKTYKPLEKFMDSLTPAARTHSNAGYPNTPGMESYRQACADYMKRRFNLDLDIKSEVSLTIASKEAVFLFPMTLVDEGDYVIIPTPGYPTFTDGVIAIGGVPYYVPLTAENNFLIDFEAIPQEIVEKAKFIWINYPNAPTGVTAPKEWLEKLVIWAKKNNIVIAADEGCYIDLYFGNKPHSILEVAKEGVIAFYTLSKRSNMTGYRIGFVAGDKEIIAKFRTIRNRVHDGAPHFVQEAGIVAWNDDSLTDEMRKIYQEKRDLIIRTFDEIGFPRTQSDATFFMWQKAPVGMSGDELAAKLLSLGIVVIPGSALSKPTADGQIAGKDYIRIALMPSQELTLEACERIKQAFNK